MHPDNVGHDAPVWSQILPSPILFTEVTAMSTMHLKVTGKRILPVKGVKEKKTKRGKERTFHRLSYFITNTLAFHSYTTLSPITKQEMKNTKEEEKEQLT